jgi:hypothetical protein
MLSFGPGKAVQRWRIAGKSCRGLETVNGVPSIRIFVYSIFTRDHAGTADDEVVEAFADAILAYDDSMPNGTYRDVHESASR